MKKLVLDVDTLEVASFETVQADTAPRGTVNAHINTIEVLRDYLSIAFCAAQV
jgi:hypothetical protein